MGYIIGTQAFWGRQLSNCGFFWGASANHPMYFLIKRLCSNRQRTIPNASSVVKNGVDRWSSMNPRRNGLAPTALGQMDRSCTEDFRIACLLVPCHKEAVTKQIESNTERINYVELNVCSIRY